MRWDPAGDFMEHAWFVIIASTTTITTITTINSQVFSNEL